MGLYFSTDHTTFTLLSVPLLDLDPGIWKRPDRTMRGNVERIAGRIDVAGPLLDCPGGSDQYYSLSALAILRKS